MAASVAWAQAGLITEAIILPVVCVAAVGLRFRLRRAQKIEILVDDLVMVPAVLLFIGMCIVAVTGVAKGIWGHAQPFGDHKMTPAAQAAIDYGGKLFETYLIIQILGLGCIKLGALLFYRRLFCIKGYRSTFRIVLWVSIAVVVVWTVVISVINGVKCDTYISSLWNKSIDYVYFCFFSGGLQMISAITNSVLDFFIILLPIPKLWSLHMSRGRKIAISGVFALALVGFAGSVARMARYIIIRPTSMEELFDCWLEDSEMIFWSNLEAGLGLLAVNLPSLWPYVSSFSFDRIRTSLRSWLSRRSTRQSHSTLSSGRRVSDDEGIAIVRRHEQETKTHTECNSETVKWSPPRNTIMIVRSIDQTDEMV